MKFKGLFVALVFLLILGCGGATEKYCEADSDCRPSECCHAKDTVNKDHGPDCSGQLCTMDCAPETIDCGQGSLKCLEKECTVVWNE